MANHTLQFEAGSLPRTRREALAIGSLHFDTGVPCIHGHKRPRFAINGRCMACNSASTTSSQKSEKGREGHLRNLQKYAKSEKGKVAIKRSVSYRRAVKAKSVPLWSDREQIDSFVNACPPDHHLDHIIPLRGKNVCGLHVTENLQYLPAQENRVKSNKVDPLTLEANVCVLPQYRSYVRE